MVNTIVNTFLTCWHTFNINIMIAAASWYTN